MTVFNSCLLRAPKWMQWRALLVPVLYAGLYTLFFSPVVFSNRFLAPGDAFNTFFPNFYAPRARWNEFLMAGFPTAADPQAMMWYPLAMIFSLIFHSWDGFVIAGYVLASSFTYGYIHRLTQSRVASIFGGIIYGMSGFMMMHFGHVGMAQSAAWLPLVIWSLEEIREPRKAHWIAIGAIGVAMMIFAGHPQIFTYSFYLYAAYIIARGAALPENRARYFVQCALTLMLGVGLAMIDLLPAYELSKLSLRAAIDYKTFTSYSLPLAQVPTLLFPMLFGGMPESPYHIPVFGAKGGPTELNGYVGLLPLMLAIIALISSKKRRGITIFWAVYAALALLLTIENSPLAPLAFHLPGLDKFRAPARHFDEFTFAISALAGLATASIERKLVTPRAVFRVVLVFTLIIIIGLIVAIRLYNDSYRELAAFSGMANLDLLPQHNPATAVPLALLLVGGVALIWWSKQPNALARQIVIGALLVCDLGSLGWFAEWRYASPVRAAAFTMPPHVARYRRALDETHERLLPVRGATAFDDGSLTNARDEIAPNLSMFWRVAVANGYNPLMLARLSGFAYMDANGSVGNAWMESENQSLNLLAVRYVTLPRSAIFQPSNGASSNLNIELGAGCGGSRPGIIYLTPSQLFETTKIEVVSALGCATQVTDGMEAASLLITDIFDHAQAQALRVGRDTSEWAYDCEETRPLMKHSRATINQTQTIERAGRKCEAHDYLATLRLERPMKVKRIELRWSGAAALRINEVKLINERNGEATFITEAKDFLNESARWRHVEDVGATSIYENLSAMPRAWLVPQVRRSSGQEILDAIHSSRLGDGAPFDPWRTALVEEDFDFPDQTANFDARNSTARILKLTATNVEIETTSATPAFLILSDVYYPGWRAEIDGQRAEVRQTDYLLRGVAVPSGKHHVRFWFKPRSFYRGLIVSLFCLIVALSLLSSRLRKLFRARLFRAAARLQL